MKAIEDHYDLRVLPKATEFLHVEVNYNSSPLANFSKIESMS